MKLTRADALMLLAAVAVLMGLAVLYELADGDKERVPAPPSACIIEPELPKQTLGGSGYFPPRVVQ